MKPKPSRYSSKQLSSQQARKENSSKKVEKKVQKCKFTDRRNHKNRIKSNRHAWRASYGGGQCVLELISFAFFIPQ